MSIGEDPLQTQKAPPDAFAARVADFRKEAADREAFVELRDDLRRAGRGDLLAEVCALHARAASTPADQVEACDVSATALAHAGAFLFCGSPDRSRSRQSINV